MKSTTGTMYLEIEPVEADWLPMLSQLFAIADTPDNRLHLAKLLLKAGIEWTLAEMETVRPQKPNPPDHNIKTVRMLITIAHKAKTLEEKGTAEEYEDFINSIPSLLADYGLGAEIR